MDVSISSLWNVLLREVVVGLESVFNSAKSCSFIGERKAHCKLQRAFHVNINGVWIAI